MATATSQQKLPKSAALFFVVRPRRLALLRQGFGGGRLAPGQREMSRATVKLRSLSPVYVPDQHHDYVNILESELAKSGSEGRPRNIALTGHYGSGKSSVLKEAQRVLEQDDVNVINL